MRRIRSDDDYALSHLPAAPSLLGAFLLSAVAGLLVFNATYSLSLRAAAAAASTPCESSSSAAAAAAAADPSLQILLETRVCGSPAVDGYEHVNASCLLASPTARWYADWTAAGHPPASLIAHLEAESDIDGIAVKWGIGNKFETPEECAADCWRHRPGAVEGPFSGLPCNAFSWCGAAVCFEPDAHNHTQVGVLGAMREGWSGVVV
jgi:hypothetical protein